MHCTLIQDMCPFQYWCTLERVYKHTPLAPKCKTKMEKEKGQKE